MDGRRIKVPLPPAPGEEGSPPGAGTAVTLSSGIQRTFRGEGMPVSKEPGKKGQLLVRYDVQMPARYGSKAFSTEDKAALKRMLLP